MWTENQPLLGLNSVVHRWPNELLARSSLLHEQRLYWNPIGTELQSHDHHPMELEATVGEIGQHVETSNHKPQSFLSYEDRSKAECNSLDAASDTSAPEIMPNTFLSYPKRVRTEDAATSTIGKSRSSICSWYYDQYRNGPEIEGALNQANKICSKHVNNGSNEWAFMDVSLSDLDSSQPSSVQRRKCSTRKRPQCSTSTQNISNLANSTQSFGQDRLDFDGESLSKCYFTGSKNGDIQSGENLVRGVDGMCFVPQTDPWTSKPVARHLHTQTSDGFPVIPTSFEPIQDKVTQPAWWLSKYSRMEYQQNGFYDSAKFSYTTVNQPVPFDPASSPFHSLTTSSSTECSRSLGEMIPNSSINEQTTTGSVHPFDLDVASMVSPDALKTGQSHPDPRLQNRAEHQTFQAPSSAESPWYPLTETSTHSQSITPPTMHAGPIQLWQFLLEELQNPNSRDYISWTGHGTEFKLKEPHQVAKLWGARKNKPKMNYEKLSRGLRYYYDKRIIQKVSGKRYVYRFTQNVYELLRSQAETYGFGWEPCVAKGAMTSPQDILRTEYGQCEPRLI